LTFPIAGGGETGIGFRTSVRRPEPPGV